MDNQDEKDFKETTLREQEINSRKRTQKAQKGRR